MKNNNISVENYDAIFSKLSQYGKSLAEDKRTILVDKETCNQKLVTVIEESGLTIKAASKNICQHLKAKKNPVMQEGMRQCNIRDCAAIMRYFAFLEEELKKPDHQLDEYTGARKMEEYRTYG